MINAKIGRTDPISAKLGQGDLFMITQVMVT